MALLLRVGRAAANAPILYGPSAQMRRLLDLLGVLPLFTLVDDEAAPTG